MGRPVTALIGSAFGNTLMLAILSALIAWVLGICAGTASAVYHNQLVDRLFNPAPQAKRVHGGGTRHWGKAQHRHRASHPPQLPPHTHRAFQSCHPVFNHVGERLELLGLGVQPPNASWGQMVNAGRQFLYYAPWISLAPSICIIVVVLAFNFLGDGLRDALDPHLRNA